MSEPKTSVNTAQLTAMSWDEFIDFGLLWWVNRQLQTLGVVIVVVADVTQEARTIKEVVPAYTNALNFEKDEESFARFQQWLLERG